MRVECVASFGEITKVPWYNMAISHFDTSAGGKVMLMLTLETATRAYVLFVQHELPESL